MREAIHRRIKKYACTGSEQVILELASGSYGLEGRQVIARRRKFGSNEQLAGETVGLGYCIRRAFVNPFSLILFGLAAISFCTDILLPDGYGQGLSTVLIILAMLVMSGVVRLTQELRAKAVAERLTELVQTTVCVCRDGVWQELSSGELVVGDLIRVEAGDRIPADIRMIHAEDFFVSQSVMTGEAGVMEKTTAPLTEVPELLSGYANIAFQGTTVTGGIGTGLVLTVGAETVYGNLSAERSDRKGNFDRGASSIALVLVRFMAILVPVVFIACGLTKQNWLEAFLFAVSVAVGLTPELLPMVINACLARGSVQMSRKQTVVKNINAMQTLGSMDVLCVDKTGTLTGDQITLEYYMDVLGNESARVLDYAFLNSRYHSGIHNHLDAAILWAQTIPGKERYYQEFARSHALLDEQPFHYDRRYAGVLVEDQGSNLHIIKGSVENVLAVCRQVDYRGQLSPLNPSDVSQNEILDELTEDGMKVIAVAYRRTTATTLEQAEDDFILLGYLAFFDAPKASAAEAIRKLQSLQMDIRVLTGDGAGTTLSICSRLGLPTDAMLTGAELDALSDDDMIFRVERTRIFCQLTPAQKRRVVEILQGNGHSVGFLGDGMNDLSAILQADVGISVDTAVEAVKECADVILLKKDLNVLEQGILEGRRAFVNMTKYIRITASSNFGNICAVVVASILLPFFPMTSIQLLLLNLLYDILCLVLPWDNVDREQIEHPIRWTGRNLERFMLRFGPISSIFDVLTFAFLFFVLCPMICGGSFGSLDAVAQLRFVAIFQTGWFLESMWTQVLILHLLRSAQLPLVQSRSSGVVFFVTIAGILLLSILTITPLAALLGLTAMPVAFYIFLVGDVLCYLLLVSLAKASYCRQFGELL